MYGQIASTNSIITYLILRKPPMWQALTKTYPNQAQQLLALLKEAEAVVVGIEAGMSATDGFTYIGPRFQEAFPDFIEKYGFLDMLQA